MKNHLIKCEHVMNKNGLCKIIFIIEEKTAPFCARELDEAAAALSEEGLEVLVIRADGHEKAAAREIPSNASALYLADSAALFQMLRSCGLPAAGYLHAGRNGESFQGAAYLVERPQDIDRDSYQKIYERAAGLPWTIAETARCLIREMTVDDVESLYPLYEDEQARRFLKPLCPDHDKEREIVKAYIDKVYGLFGYGMWVVIRKSDGALIGRAGFEVGRKNEAALGYLFRKDCRRQGYAFEACDAVMRFAREELGFTGEDAAPLLTAYVPRRGDCSLALALCRLPVLHVQPRRLTRAINVLCHRQMSGRYVPYRRLLRAINVPLRGQMSGRYVPYHRLMRAPCPWRPRQPVVRHPQRPRQPVVRHPQRPRQPVSRHPQRPQYLP